MQTSYMEKVSEEWADLKMDMQEGFELIVNPDRSSIIIEQKGCSAQLMIRFTAEGLMLHTHQDKLSISAEKEIEMRAPKISLNATKELSLHSNGNIVQHAAKDVLLECKGTTKNISAHQKIVATHTNVELKANDDVKLEGERVLLNS